MEKVKNGFKAINRFIVTNVIKLYSKIVYRYKVIGKENIPKEGSVLFCGNHRSNLDPPMMVIACPRKMRFIAKEELKNNLLFRYLCYVYEAIYVKRDSKDITALKDALKTLKNGQCIAIFPEGTRNGIEKGEQVKGGAAFFALRTGAKVVPVGLSGGLKPFQKVTITYGKPLDFSDRTMNKENEKEVLESTTECIMNNILELANN